MILPMRAPLACLLLPLALASGGCELMIAGPREQASDRWEKTYEVSPTATLEVDNTNGSISVRSHTNPTIQVVAHRTARAVSQEGARDLLGRMLMRHHLHDVEPRAELEREVDRRLIGSLGMARAVVGQENPLEHGCPRNWTSDCRQPSRAAPGTP